VKREKEDLITLRCFAYEGKNAGKDGYYAFCVDLSLATWRPTFQLAKASLNQAIYGYIEAKVKNSSPEECKKFRKLILRPAPIFPYWARYYAIKFNPKRNGRPKSPRIYEKPINQNIFCAA